VPSFKATGLRITSAATFLPAPPFPQNR